MQYILFVILSFLIGTILFYLSNNKCEPFTIGNDIQLSQNLKLTSKSPCECATELRDNPLFSESEPFTIEPGKTYKVTRLTTISGSFTNNGTLCIEKRYDEHDIRTVTLFINSNEFENKGKIYNNGYIYNNTSANITNSSGAIITNNDLIYNNMGTITNSSGATITNLREGTINNSSGATITNSSGAGINNDGHIYNFDNSTITNSNGANIYNYKYIKSTKYGLINNNGTIENNGRSQLYICGNYNGNGEIINYGDICSKDIDSISLTNRGGTDGNCNETQCE